MKASPATRVASARQARALTGDVGIMIAKELLNAAQSRLARHYLSQLRAASATYSHGMATIPHALTRFDADWLQIRHWQSWSAEWTLQDRDRAELCASFAASHFALLRIRLSNQELLDWLLRALAAAEVLNQARTERELLHYVVLAHLEVEAWDVGLRYAERLLTQSRDAQDRLGEARALMHMGAVKNMRGQNDLAEVDLKNSLRLLKSMTTSLDYARAMNHLGRVAVFRGDYSSARNYHVACVTAAESANNPAFLAAALYSGSGSFLFLNEVRAAQEYAQRAVNVTRLLGNPRSLMGAYISLGHVQKQLGDYVDACRSYEEGVTQLRLGGPPSSLINGLYGWAQAQFLLGEPEKAMVLLDEALSLAVDRHIPFRICEVAADRALIASVMNDRVIGIDSLRACVTQCQIIKTARYNLMTVGAGVVVAGTFGYAEQAAQWMGCVSGCPEYVERMGIFQSACRRLETELGSERYHVLLEQGKARSLDDVVLEIDKFAMRDA
jgi:tetratricopeptide (TPR) repeat protein